MQNGAAAVFPKKRNGLRAADVLYIQMMLQRMGGIERCQKVNFLNNAQPGVGKEREMVVKSWKGRAAVLGISLLTASSMCFLSSVDLSYADSTKTDASATAVKTATAASTKIDKSLVPHDPKLVYCDKSAKKLADKDALVFLILGDGFTKSDEQKFYDNAKATAKYMMKTAPYSEYKDSIKFYALFTISKDSGAQGADAQTVDEAKKDNRSTYFGATYWSTGMQRLVTLPESGAAKVKALKQNYLNGNADFELVMVNSEVYGGSGGDGDYCVASLNDSSLEMMLHELGHTIGKLADEYWAGPQYAYEYPNMTKISDPKKVKWKKFIGKDGIGVYEYDNGGDGWYHPSKNCKMQYLGAQYPFCDVCKEQLRKAFSQNSNITKIFYQPYAKTFYQKSKGTDMKKYFILRRGKHETTGDKLGKNLTLTYYNSKGKKVKGIPYKHGTYTIKAVFKGNKTYKACSMKTKYKIEYPNLITLSAKDKVYDGKAAKVGIKVKYSKPYTTKTSWTGTIQRTKSGTPQTVKSTKAPVVPGSYTVKVTAYDKKTKKKIAEKTASFKITFKTTSIVDNNDSDVYWGAAPYYNNKTIVIQGEGFTRSEQGEFEKLAKEYASYITSQDPFRETKVFFNFTSIEAESNKSGIGSTAGDSYYKLSYDSNGKIVPTDNSTDSAVYLSYYGVTAYYKASIVIVNDKNVKEGTVSSNTIYTGLGESGKKYAAKELLNYLTGKSEGYEAKTDSEKSAQRTALLKELYYEGYPIITADPAGSEVKADGKAVDMSKYFHTYIEGEEVSGLTYTMTYYKVENGKTTKLDSAPSEAGTYLAKAEIVPDSGKEYKTISFRGSDYQVPLTRGQLEFTIK